MKRSICIVLLSSVFSGCVKDKPEETVPTNVQLSSAKKVYVINEGPYTSGKASVTLYDPQKNESVEDIYFSQNNSSPGDVAQSLSFINNSFYLVMNNSKKIIVCDAQFKKTGQINGLTSPRYILAVSNQKAYVTDLYANAISVVNLNTLTKTGDIPCPGMTEKMISLYDKVFVSNSAREYVYVINASQDKITDSLYVGLGASSLVLDKEDKIWVLASGNRTNKAGRLSKINALTMQNESYWEFAITEGPWNLCLNQTKDTLFYLNEHIYRMPITSANLPATALIQKGSKNFYGLGVDPHNFTIYAADALDYSQRSNIYIYDQSGKQINLFKAGINANGFYFE